MNILVISNNYPSKAVPNNGAFVYNLMQELSKEHNVTVISPNKVHFPLKKKQESYGDEECKVHRPVYLSVSNKRMVGINTGNISSYFYNRAVQKEIENLREKPDIIYVHFLANALPVLNYAEKNNIPLFIASGESTYTSWKEKPEDLKTKLKKLVTHIICVSTENQKQLVEMGFDLEKISVIPNAVDYSRFKPLDKTTCKKRMKIDSSKFVVGFIGHFINRKGPNRIIEAIESIGDKDIHLVCVGGKGQLKRNNFSKEIAPVPNFLLPDILNAFDIFVLPTLNEGHCNVIEEAKACGIPIVSSKGTSVEEQIDDSIGILIDPLDIDEIASAIVTLKNDTTLRQSMEKKLLRKRGERSMEERAQKINQILLRSV